MYTCNFENPFSEEKSLTSATFPECSSLLRKWNVLLFKYLLNSLESMLKWNILFYDAEMYLVFWFFCLLCDSQNNSFRFSSHALVGLGELFWKHEIWKSWIPALFKTVRAFILNLGRCLHNMWIILLFLYIWAWPA